MQKEGDFRIRALRFGPRSESALLAPRNSLAPFKEIPAVTHFLTDPPETVQRLYKVEADFFASMAKRLGWTTQPEFIPIEFKMFIMDLFVKNYLWARAPTVPPSIRVQHFHIQVALKKYEKQQVGAIFGRPLDLNDNVDYMWRQSIFWLAKFIYTQYKWDHEARNCQPVLDLRPITESRDFNKLKKSRVELMKQGINLQ